MTVCKFTDFCRVRVIQFQTAMWRGGSIRWRTQRGRSTIGNRPSWDAEAIGARRVGNLEDTNDA